MPFVSLFSDGVEVCNKYSRLISNVANRLNPTSIAQISTELITRSFLDSSGYSRKRSTLVRFLRKDAWLEYPLWQGNCSEELFHIKEVVL